jgi:hypothetical protein
MTPPSGQLTKSEHGVPPWLMWATAGIGLAVCTMLLLLWGLHGPTYIFDLIAAFCG